uniref:Branched-chain amino acid aminotransferase n=1 Tax=Nannochloropsis gaditana (strain CCMP526) TaxID=1093141 RepID=I2CQ49_NANGC
MNVFFFWINEQGEKELITAPLCRGDVLPGVTRRSILELAGKWREFKVTERAVGMKEVVKAKKEGRLLEAFGAGTAVVVCPIRAILYEEEDVVVIKEGDDVGPLTKRMWDALTDIQYGKVDHPWSVLID